MRADLRVGRQVPGRGLLEHQVGEVAVDLVGGGEDHRGGAAARADRLQQVERAEDVDLEVVARVLHAGGHRDLRRHVEHRVRFVHGGGQPVAIADVGMDEADAVAVVRLQPLQVALGPGAAQRVIDDDIVPLAG